MKRPKILLVDDLVENLVSLEMILADFDLDFVRASSGHEALRATMKDEFAMAILDVQMPGMDGYETLSLMRSRLKTRYLPVIFVSAIHQSDLHIIRGIETGAVDFIPKPIIPEILAGKVKVFLDLYQQKQEMVSLLARLDQQNNELTRQREMAEKANEAKSLYLAYMTHEIRTPLTGIIGLSKILEKTKLDPEQQHLVETIVRSGDNLVGIINEILDFSKIESGQVMLDLTEVNLEKIVNDVVELLRFKADEKGLSLKVKADPLLPGLVEADSLRISQILTNLVNNALKFTEKGGVEVMVALEGEADGVATVRIEVADTGIGISEEGLSRLFKDYSQAEVSTSRKYGGTGLGLAISKRLAELMHGTIGVNSTFGEGSTFSVLLPLAIVEKNKPLNNDGPGQNSGEWRILVAEDNKANQMVIKYQLKNMGLTCDMASDGHQAVALFSEKRYNVVLMDMNMPGMDGIEATCRIRQFEKEHQLTPACIVAITANVYDEERNMCLEAGMNGFLGKPFRDHELLELLNSAYGKQ